MNDKFVCPCKECKARKTLAKMYDMHVWGEDCPYDCRRYGEWKNRAQNKESIIKATIWLFIVMAVLILVASVWGRILL